MANLLRNPSDVANAALVRLGAKHRVGDLYDGSAVSRAVLDVYGQTRDELLRARDYDFSSFTASLGSALKTAPVGGYTSGTPWSDTYPPPGWIYEYAYPADCLKVRSLKAQPPLIPNFNPIPRVFSIAEDIVEDVKQKVILTNVASAICVYTRQVTDPLEWDVLFTEALAAALARRLAPAIAGMDAAKMEAQDEAFSTAMAAMTQG